MRWGTQFFWQSSTSSKRRRDIWGGTVAVISTRAWEHMSLPSSLDNVFVSFGSSMDWIDFALFVGNHLAYLLCALHRFLFVLAMADSKMKVGFAIFNGTVKVVGISAGSILNFSSNNPSHSSFTDLTNNTGKLEEVLEGMTVNELCSVFTKLGFAGIPRNPKKAPLIRTFLGNIDELKANALRLSTAMALNETGAGGASSTGHDGGYASAFQGKAHTLSGEDDETASKESNEKDDDTVKDFVLIVKSSDLDQHLFFKINRHDTVLNIKDKITRPSLDGFFDKEEDFMASAVLLEMFDKENTKELDNFTTFAEIFPGQVHGGEVLLKFQKEFDQNSEMAKTLVSGSYFRKVMRTIDKDINNSIIQEVHPSMRKGTMEIRVCETVKVFYQFGEVDTVADVCKAMAKHIDDGLDFDDSGCFRMKHHETASFMRLYQPLWAEFGPCPIAEIVISLRGGGKRMTVTKKQGKIKELKSMVVAHASETAGMEKTDLMKSVDGIIEAFGNQVEVDAVSALKGYIGSNSLLNLEKMLTVLEESKTGGAEGKIRSITTFFFGDQMKKLADEHDTHEKIIGKGKMVLEYGFMKSELGLSKFKTLVNEAVIFKRGHQSASVAMET